MNFAFVLKSVERTIHVYLFCRTHTHTRWPCDLRYRCRLFRRKNKTRERDGEQCTHKWLSYLVHSAWVMLMIRCCACVYFDMTNWTNPSKFGSKWIELRVNRMNRKWNSSGRRRDEFVIWKNRTRNQYLHSVPITQTHVSIKNKKRKTFVLCVVCSASVDRMFFQYFFAFRFLFLCCEKGFSHLIWIVWNTTVRCNHIFDNCDNYPTSMANVEHRHWTAFQLRQTYIVCHYIHTHTNGSHRMEWNSNSVVPHIPLVGRALT